MIFYPGDIAGPIAISQKSGGYMNEKAAYLNVCGGSSGELL